MPVELTFDLVVDLRFLFTGSLPIALKEEIGSRKNEIYARLSQDLSRPDMRTGSEQFVVEGRKFEVLFASDQRQIGPSSVAWPLRVIDIQEIH